MSTVLILLLFFYDAMCAIVLQDADKPYTERVEVLSVRPSASEQKCSPHMPTHAYSLPRLPSSLLPSIVTQADSVGIAVFRLRSGSIRMGEQGMQNGCRH